MAIRLSGMASGLDTDTMVKELMSAYSIKKDNLVKAQTKLQWKQDSWKDMNSKIYSFYSNSLSKMRFTSTYSLKSASISNTAMAKISASSTAVSGTQTLLVKELASSGYLTGGEIESSDAENPLKGSSKLSDVKGMNFGADGTAKLNVNVAGEDHSITVNADTTINDFVVALKDAGVNANFDEKNGRFFISAKTSGKENDFSLTADDSNGLNVLQSLKLYTANETDLATYKKWSEMTDDEIAAAKDAAYEKNKYTVEGVLNSYKSNLKAALDGIDTLTDSNEELTKKIEKLEAEKADDILTEEDRQHIDKEIEKYTKQIADNDEKIAKHQDTVTEMNQYVVADGDSEEVQAQKAAALEAKVTELNEGVRARQDSIIDDRVAMSKEMMANGATVSEGAVRTVGADSVIELNGATFTSNTNNYEINGLTIQAMEVSKDGKAATITTGTDVDGIYNMVKDFFKSYNELIIGMDKAYNAASSGDYEPLTDEEKSEMSDKEIEKWETKIKDALLRRDDTLGSITDMMKTAMLKGFTVNGKTMTLSSFGISTMGYFASADNEKGAYHIDGDPDDAKTAGNADKLRAAIANDPDSVVSFFTQLSNNLYDNLTKKMAGTKMSSAYTVYNDKKMQSDYDEYKEKIATWEEKLEKMEESYFKKFSAMETALTKLQSSTSSLTSLFGG